MVLRGCVFGLAVLSLVSCDQLPNGIPALGGTGDVTNEGIRTLALLGGEVRARGPEGYCIDQSASNARRGFAVLAGCALLSDAAVVMPRLDGLVTVQFGEENTASVAGNETGFADFLKSNAGLGLLAAGGDVADLSNVAIVTDSSGVLVRLTDASGPVFAGTSGPQWRGFMDVNGRLTTVSVLSFERNELTPQEAERLLIVTMNELVAANVGAQPVDENS